MLFKIFIIVFLIVAACMIGRAFVTGSVQLRGEKGPIRRQERPREFRQTMGIITVVFALLVVILAWIFLIPLFRNR
jgi:hypothetical protein